MEQGLFNEKESSQCLILYENKIYRGERVHKHKNLTKIFHTCWCDKLLILVKKSYISSVAKWETMKDFQLNYVGYVLKFLGSTCIPFD